MWHAWFWMAETMRVNQNIERTHPKRMDLKSFEASSQEFLKEIVGNIVSLKFILYLLTNKLNN